MDATTVIVATMPERSVAVMGVPKARLKRPKRSGAARSSAAMAYVRLTAMSNVALEAKSEVVKPSATRDRKSTRLNSSHGYISYAVFCLITKEYYHSQYTTTVP